MTFCIEGIKIINLGYLAILYTFIGIQLSLIYTSILSYIEPDHIINIDEALKSDNIGDFLEKKPNFYRQLQFYTLVDCLGVFYVAYNLRQIVKYIPFPLDGICGFETKRVKEQNGSVLLATMAMVYFTFKDKLKLYQKIYEYDKSYIVKQTGLLVIVLVLINIIPMIIKKII